MDCTEKIPMQLADKHAFQINGEWRTGIMVSCGKCAACIMTRKSVWGFRLAQEAERSHTAYFVTLTYDPEHVPYNKYGQRILIKAHLQDFFKRLRHHTNKGEVTWEHFFNNLPKQPKIKYFACGEYGEKKGRPHYHAIIFNTTKDAIYKAWTIGNVMVAPANKATMSYVMKYLDKQNDKTKDWKRPPEFQIQSKDIGTNYIERNKKFHKSNLDIQYMTDRQGIKYPIPDSFRKKLFSEDERLEILKIVNESLNEQTQDIISKMGASGPSKVTRSKAKRQKLILTRARRKKGNVEDNDK